MARAARKNRSGHGEVSHPHSTLRYTRKSFIAQQVLAFFTGKHRIIAALVFYEGACQDNMMLRDAGLHLAIPER